VTLTYFASLCSLDDDIDQAEITYTQILAISPSDAFALKELKRISDAKRLKPVQTVGAQKGNIEAFRTELAAKGIRGYDVTRAPPSQRDIVVAVLGTGISSSLKDDIKDRLVDAISVVPGEADIIDSQGHGTAVISLVAALAPHAKIISIKCLGKSGAGDFDTIAKGIDAAVSHKADLLVVPLGSGQTAPAVQNSMRAALTAGILVVAAAGNDGEERVDFPANIIGVLSVGATNHQDVLTTFSNYGGSVSLYAEGQGILVYGLTGEQLTQSGTSFSAAIVAAIAAATWSARPDNSSDQIRRLLIDTAIDISNVNEARLRVPPLRRIDGLKAIAGQ
jgi:subtilisin family serine protease